MNIETKHLILKPPIADSLNEASKLWEDDKVRMFLGGTISSESTQEKIVLLRAHWDKYKFGLYTVFLKDTSRIIGLCGLHRSEFESDIELSYMFFPEFWGKGLATEAVLACLEDGFKNLKFKRVIAITQKSNIASCRLLEKAGMQLVQEFVRFNAEQCLYEKRNLLKLDWERSRTPVEIDKVLAQSLIVPFTDKEISCIDWLSSGCINTNYKVTLLDGSKLLLRIYARDSQSAKK